MNFYLAIFLGFIAGANSALCSIGFFPDIVLIKNIVESREMYGQVKVANLTGSISRDLTDELGNQVEFWRQEFRTSFVSMGDHFNTRLSLLGAPFDGQDFGIAISDYWEVIHHTILNKVVGDREANEILPVLIVSHPFTNYHDQTERWIMSYHESLNYSEYVTLVIKIKDQMYVGNFYVKEGTAYPDYQHMLSLIKSGSNLQISSLQSTLDQYYQGEGPEVRNLYVLILNEK